MLPGFAAAAMRALPRTAAPRRQPAAQPPQPCEGGSDEAASAGSSSPREVLGGIPQHACSGGTRKAAQLQLQLQPQGHAVDVVQLLGARWFGPLRGLPEGETTEFGDTEDDEEAAAERMRAAARVRRGRQQQQEGQEGGGRCSDASPSSSSHRSGGSSGQAGRSSALPQPTLPQPISLTWWQQQQQQAVQNLPGIGTWAGRYRLFGPQQPTDGDRASAGAQRQEAGEQEQEQRQEQTPAAAVAAAAAEQRGDFGSPVVLCAGGFNRPAAGETAGLRRGPHHQSSYNSEQAQEEAWRWRFSRKWATEQQKYYDAADPASVASDDLDALHFTQACGMGVNLQVLPNSTPQPGRHLGQAAAGDGPSRLEHATSNLSLCQFEGEHSFQSALLGAEMSPGGSQHGAIAAGQIVAPGAAATAAGASARQASGRQAQPWQGAPSPSGPSATRSVLTMANKARDLLQKQGAIEAAVQDRWERSCTAGDAWAGRNLSTVQIDTWGRFQYCVLRVSDGAGHTRFLVRGRSGCSPPVLLEEAAQEAGAASRTAGVPAATVEVVGEGIMEWREDTERELHLTPSTLPLNGLHRRTGSSDSPTKAPSYLGDVSSLTASLVRQALPCHFRVTTAATAGRSSSFASALANRA